MEKLFKERQADFMRDCFNKWQDDWKVRKLTAAEAAESLKRVEEEDKIRQRSSDLQALAVARWVDNYDDQILRLHFLGWKRAVEVFHRRDQKIAFRIEVMDLADLRSCFNGWTEFVRERKIAKHSEEAINSSNFRDAQLTYGYIRKSLRNSIGSGGTNIATTYGSTPQNMMKAIAVNVGDRCSVFAESAYNGSLLRWAFASWRLVSEIDQLKSGHLGALGELDESIQDLLDRERTARETVSELKKQLVGQSAGCELFGIGLDSFEGGTGGGPSGVNSSNIGIALKSQVRSPRSGFLSPIALSSRARSRSPGGLLSPLALNSPSESQHPGHPRIGQTTLVVPISDSGPRSVWQGPMCSKGTVTSQPDVVIRTPRGGLVGIELDGTEFPLQFPNGLVDNHSLQSSTQNLSVFPSEATEAEGVIPPISSQGKNLKSGSMLGSKDVLALDAVLHGNTAGLDNLAGQTLGPYPGLVQESSESQSSPTNAGFIRKKGSNVKSKTAKKIVSSSGDDQAAAPTVSRTNRPHNGVESIPNESDAPTKHSSIESVPVSRCNRPHNGLESVPKVVPEVKHSMPVTRGNRPHNGIESAPLNDFIGSSQLQSQSRRVELFDPCEARQQSSTESESNLSSYAGADVTVDQDVDFQNLQEQSLLSSVASQLTEHFSMYLGNLNLVSTATAQNEVPADSDSLMNLGLSLAVVSDSVSEPRRLSLRCEDLQIPPSEVQVREETQEVGILPLYPGNSSFEESANVGKVQETPLTESDHGDAAAANNADVAVVSD